MPVADLDLVKPRERGVQRRATEVAAGVRGTGQSEVVVAHDGEGLLAWVGTIDSGFL